jgi:integrase
MLSDTKLRALKPKDKHYRLTDERGLYVQVATSGSKLWRFKYKFDAKEKLLALGQYPDVPLALARERRDEARQLLARGIDPAAQKQAAKAGDGTFGAVFEAWFAGRKGSMAENTVNKDRMRADNYVLPSIGRVPVNEITSGHILPLLRLLEQRGIGETAKRVRQLISMVMQYAIASNLAATDPTLALRKALNPVVVKHRAAITDRSVLAAFLRAAHAYPASPIVRAALLLQTLLFVRPGELRHAEWTEFDLARAVWKIPGEKMKMRDAHIVPLSTQALAILAELHPFTGKSRWVFPSPRSMGQASERPMSENGVLVALRSMGYDKETVTGHGFRATARTFLDEDLRIRPEVIEAQLAHSVRDPLGRAYNRTKHLEERTAMMQAWADWLDLLCAQSGP